MSDNCDKDFLFDAVVGFLTSPIWNTPVMTFVEQNSLVFNPEGETLEAHKDIHTRYKTMVETLLSSFLQDVGISEEEFTNSCSRVTSGTSQFGEVQKEIFEQVWAAEDFEVFKRLMVQKNIDLQLQALRLIQLQSPETLTPGSDQTPPPVHSGFTAAGQQFGMDEDTIMAEIIRKSKEEYEAQQEINKDADKELEAAILKSQEVERNRLMEISRREEEEMKKAINTSILGDRENLEKKKPLKEDKKTPTIKQKGSIAQNVTPEKLPTINKPQQKSVSSSAACVSKASTGSTTAADAAASWIKNAREEAASTSSSRTGPEDEMTKEELERREGYLKQQRDKLLAMKRQTREKHLTKFTEQQPKARPTSAQTARRVTAGEKVESASKNPADDQKKFAMRRALADALKREVIDKSD